MNDLAKNLILWIVIAVVLMSVFNSFSPRSGNTSQIPYSQFIEEVKSGRVQSVTISDDVVRGVLEGGTRFTTYAPNDPKLVDELLASNVAIEAKPPEQQSLLMQIFIS